MYLLYKILYKTFGYFCAIPKAFTLTLIYMCTDLISSGLSQIYKKKYINIRSIINIPLCYYYSY
jgi:hypothetical protein